MKPGKIILMTFLFLSLLAFKAFAQQSQQYNTQQGTKMLSKNVFLRIVGAGKSYSMAEFTPQIPIKIEAKGPGKLIIYIKTAISEKYGGLPGFRLFIKRDNYLINQYMFPKTTRSTLSFEGIKGYNASAEVNSIPIDVPEGIHTYDIYLSQSPYIIGLASFGYTPHAVKHISMSREKSINRIVRNEHNEQGQKKAHERSLYISPYLMVGEVYEQGADGDSVYGGVGINADVFIDKKLVVSGMIDYSDSAERYPALNNLQLPAEGGGFIVNEQILLVQALLSYAFLHSDKNTFMFGIGWGDLEMINDLLQGKTNGPVVSALFQAASQSASLQESTYNINGPVVSALLKIGLSESTSLCFRPSYMQDIWNVSGNTSSILGTPSSVLLYPIGFAFNLSSAESMQIGYAGRMLIFQDSNRFYNGVFVSAIF